MIEKEKVETVLIELFNDSKYDRLKMIKGATKSVVRPMRPSDFKDAYLSISREQGEDLAALIKEKNIKNIVEFGTSFGISTLFLAQGILETEGHIITTELIESKAQRAIENFKRAGVSNLIEVRVGNAMETLKHYTDPIDLLLLDGWKDLYLPLFLLLEKCFHKKTIIYVDNADMKESRLFLNKIAENEMYKLQPKFGNKVVFITLNK